MPAGTGLLFIPIITVSGGSAPTGAMTLPIFVVLGGSGMAQESYNIPVPVIEGTGRSADNAGINILPTISLLASGDYPVVRGDGNVILPVLLIGSADMFRGIGSLTLPLPLIHSLNYPVGNIILPSLEAIGYGRAIPISRIFSGVTMNISNKA